MSPPGHKTEHSLWEGSIFKIHIRCWIQEIFFCCGKMFLNWLSLCSMSILPELFFMFFHCSRTLARFPQVARLSSVVLLIHRHLLICPFLLIPSTLESVTWKSPCMYSRVSCRSSRNSMICFFTIELI